MGHRADPAVPRRPAPTGTGGWIWVVFAKDPEKRRAAAKFILDIEAPRERGAHQRRHRPPARAPERLSRLPELPGGAVRVLRRDARARPARGRPCRSTTRSRASCRSQSATPSKARAHLSRRWTTRCASSSRGGRAAAHARASRARASIRWRGCRRCSRSLLGGVRAARAPAAGVRLWLAPAVVLVAVFLLYPILELVRIAFTDLGAPGRPYRYTLARISRARSRSAVLRDDWRHADVRRRVGGAAAGLGLLLAWLFDAAERRRVVGSLAARVAVVSAWVIPGVLIGVIWKILLIENRSGIVNYWLSQIGLGPAPLLSSSTLALGSVIVANTWRGTRVQHADAVRGTAPHSARAARSGGSRGAERRGSACGG